MACLLRYQRLNPGLMKMLAKCFIVSEGSEQNTQCQEISLCPGGGRTETWNELTPQSSISKVAQAGDRLCQEKRTHTCALTHAPSTEGFHIQLWASDTNESSPQQYRSISFQQFLLSSPIRCWSMAELTRVRQFALYSALGQSETMHCCLSGTLRCKDLRNWDFPFRSWCFFSSQPLRVSNRFKVRD